MRFAQRLTRPLVLMLGAFALLSGAEAGKGVAQQNEQPKAPKGATAQPTATGAFDEAAVKKAAGDIDAIIDAALARDKVKPTARTRDDQFLRRIYLDLAGRIPTIDEAGPFLASSRKDKREALVKQLLAGEAYVSNTFTWWADMLRARTRLQDRFEGKPYIDWIKQSVRENKPYDKMDYELICAQGPGTRRGNGATGYYAVDAGMPQDNMANTVRLFLGTRLSCAQCHNHPFDKWTRKDFFQMVAFTEGTEVKTSTGDLERAVRALKGEAPYSTGFIAGRMGETLGMNISNGDKGEITLPDNYQYDDAHPKDRIRARTMFNEDILGAGALSVREAYGRWMTAPGNARFTLVAANRMWKRLMRVGFIEPLDNLEDDTKPFNQELADDLVQLLKDVRYDMRTFQEVVCRTNAYQRQSIAGDADRFKFHHEGQPLRRLTAEQMWDSLMTLTVPDLDAIKDDGAEVLYRFYDANHDKSTQELAQIVLKAGQAQDQIEDLEKQVRAIRQEMEKGTDKGQGDSKIKDLWAKETALRPAADLFTPYYAKGVSPIGPLVRASELPSPMPPGHFLRVFGQSNRLLIDNSTDSLNLTQALELMNGMVETTIFGDDKSVLSLELAKGRTMDDKVLILYAAILSRLPAAFEVEYGHKVMALAPSHRGVQYLGWALVNSAEFAFNE